MKLHALASSLSAALAVAERATAPKSTLPVLSQVLLATDGELLTVTGTDLEFRASASASARIDEPGEITLPPNLLKDFLDSLPGSEAVTLETLGNHRAVLTCGRSVTRIAGLDPEPFPPTPSFDDATFDITLSAPMLAELIRGTAYAVAPTDDRPVLAGVSLVVADDTLTLAAADGFRLSIRQEHLDTSAPDISLIVHGKRLAQVGSLLAKSTSARLRVDERQSSLLVDSEAGSWCIRLIEGQFPDWRRIVPLHDRVRATVTVLRDDLIRAGRLVKSVSEENLRIVRLTAADGSLTVGARDAQDQEAVGVIDAELAGDAMAVAFNGRYLADAVASFDGAERVTLELVAVNLPGIVRALDGPSGNLCVIMPMHNAKKPEAAP